MPALVKSKVGSLAGTSEDECTRLWPLLSKKRRNFSRISEPVGIFFIVSKSNPKPLKHRRKEDAEESWCISRIAKSAKIRSKLKPKTFETHRNGGSRGMV